MRGPLRIKFFKWLLLQTMAVFVAVLVVVTLFNIREAREHPGTEGEELEEAVLVIGLLGMLLPAALASAWLISRRLLEPLQKIVEPAEQICAGKLDQRIAAENDNDEIGRLTRTLNAAFDRYQEALARLERFSYDAAHQFRNPLAAIRTAGETCLQQERSAADYRATIGEMLEDVQRLSDTVHQLLTLARLAHQDLRHHFQPVGLTTLLRELADEVQPIVEGRDLQLRLQLPATEAMVMGLTNLLHEAFANLLDNAVRFIPSNGTITLELGASRPGTWTLVVEDSGPGIPVDYRARIFQPFQKLGAGTPESTGLGLAIVGDVVRLHRGTIELSTSVLGGCRFSIDLPAAESEPAVIGPADGPAAIKT